ncbi:MAG: Beta-propeller repeat protein, partial [Verrucomicrobia bacterium]|nr:Beta-propeller repeat protein [Verrucomicrobiota bacterium]
GHGIAVDAAGNAYLGGFTGGLGKLGGHSLTNATGRDVLVAKFTSAGEVAWVAQGHGSTNAMAHEISVDAKGNVWASGMFKGVFKFDAAQSATSQGDNDWLLVHYDSAGRQRWARHGGGPKVDYGLAVVNDERGNAFLTGEFSETATFGEKTLPSRGSTDIFLAAFDSKGTLATLLQAGGEKGDNAYVITRDRQGNLYLSGSFGGTAVYGEHRITSGGGNDVYVTKVRVK